MTSQQSKLKETDSPNVQLSCAILRRLLLSLEPNQACRVQSSDEARALRLLEDQEWATLRSVGTTALLDEDELAPRQVSTEELADDDPPETAAMPTMHRCALHGPAGEFVTLLEPHTEADPAALLIQALVAFGSCAGRSAHVRVGVANHFANLFALLVGGTSRGRKGLSWSEVARLFGEVDPDWRKTRVQSGLSSGEGLINAVRDASGPDKPDNESSRTSDGRRSRGDPGVSDKRLLVLESEFGGTLRVAAREGNILSAVLRQAWDDGALRVLSRNTAACATNSHISIVGHITGEELRRQLSKTDAANGFANRFLFVHVQRSKLLPEGGGTPALSQVVERIRSAVTFAQSCGHIDRDDEGRKLWRRAYPILTAPRTGLLGAATGRAEAQVLRLSLVYALLDRSPIIRVEHIAAAIAVWSYCESSAAYVLGSALGDRIADGLLQALRSSKEGLSKTEVRDLFGRHDAEPLLRALGMLQELKLAEFASVPTRGRSKQVWRATKATEGSDGGLLSLLSHLGGRSNDAR